MDPPPDGLRHEGVWKANAAALSSLRDWGGEYAVFNPASGDSHLLDIVAGELLAALAGGPLAAPALYARIAALLEVDNDRQLAESVDAILAHLDEIGLIEPVPAC